MQRLVSRLWQGQICWLPSLWDLNGPTMATAIAVPLHSRSMRSKDRRSSEKDRKKKQNKDQKGATSHSKPTCRFSSSAVTRLHQFMVSTKQCSKQPSRRNSTGTEESVDSEMVVKEAPRISSLSRVLQFLQLECPHDVLGKVLCYSGPRTSSVLSESIPYFCDFLAMEEVWRVFCEEWGKWNPNVHEEPSCWKDYYNCHPCVPDDFDTVHDALEATLGTDPSRSISILLRPGVHEVDKPLNIHTSHRMVQVRLETIKRLCTSQSNQIGRAVLVSSFGKHEQRNCPLISVALGKLDVKNVALRHSSAGVDIWNGNTVLQIQPTPNQNPSSFQPPNPALPPVSVTLAGVDISSETGRGVVLRGNAQLRIEDSFIHDCAGTGIYIGHQGAGMDRDLLSGRVNRRAQILNTDIYRNGLGNSRGGIPRGHSGLYIEEGRVDVSHCAISRNSSCGISVISTFDASLHMSHCHVVDNGGTPLELANVDRHRLEENTISAVGFPPVFSSVLRALGKLQDEEEEEEDDDDDDWEGRP